MDNEVFDATKLEITEFRKLIARKLNDRDSKTLDAIDRDDSYGDLAQYAESDAENPELVDLTTEFEDFAESMRDADEAWAED